jgi:hypothetical protein
MVNQTDTLERLNKEKEYEDKLSADLTDYFLTVLDDISDITPAEKEKIRTGLSLIAKESTKHKHMFDMLIQKVLEYGENNY